MKEQQRMDTVVVYKTVSTDVYCYGQTRLSLLEYIKGETSDG